MSNCIIEIIECFYERDLAAWSNLILRVCRRKPVWQTNLFLVVAR